MMKTWLFLLLLISNLVVAAPTYDWPSETNVVISRPTTSENITITEGGDEVFQAEGGKGTYNWTTSKGSFLLDAHGNPVTIMAGNPVIYTAPQCGNCSDFVTVTDAYGDRDTTYISVVVPNVPTSCTISPTKASLSPGEEKEFELFGNNNTVIWTVDNGGEIEERGKKATFKAGAVGTYHITGTDMYDSKCSATATINVETNCYITPQAPVVQVDSEQQFDMVGSDCDDIYWLAQMGTIDQDGRYKAPVIPGEYDITAIVNTTGYSETVKITVTPECLVKPQNIHLQPGASKFITIISGNKPYIVSAEKAEIEKSSSEDVFEYVASNQTGDDTVTICCGNTMQEECSKVSVSVEKMYVDLLKVVEINNTYEFEVTGGKAEYHAQADFGTIDFGSYGKHSGKGTYTAPEHETTDTITIRDSVNNTVMKSVEVRNYISPIISPSTVHAVALDEVLDFSVVGGITPFTWNYTGREIVPNSRNATITVKGSIGTYHLSVTDGRGKESEKVAIPVTLSLMISPKEYTIYKGESDKAKIRFDISGGAGVCEWISDKIQINEDGKDDNNDYYVNDYYIIVEPQIKDRPVGTQYKVTCRDQNGKEATAIITVAKLTFDSDNDGLMNSDETQRAINQFFVDRAEELINKMDGEELFHHLDNFLQ